MISEVADQALCRLVEIAREYNLGLHNHFENFEGIIVHKGTLAHHHFKYEHTKCVPVDSLAMTFVHDDLRGKIFWRTANCVCSFIAAKFLDEAKV